MKLRSIVSAVKFRHIVAVLILVGAIMAFVGEKTDKIAVLNVEGVILDSEPYTRAIREIEKNDSYKALVVRVDSPGGSVAASQEIYSLIKRVGRKIPVIASMGSMAASGGYYVSCGASHIFANPGTITGSVGVIATFANYGELLRWAKVDFEIVKTGKFKDAGSPLRPLGEKDREYFQTMIDNALEQFKSAVAENRDISTETLKYISDGRAILGQSAMELGLVDEMGTLLNAIEKAAEKAGIAKNSPVKRLPENEFGLPGLISAEISSKLLKRHLPAPVLQGSGLYYLSEWSGLIKNF